MKAFAHLALALLFPALVMNQIDTANPATTVTSTPTSATAATTPTTTSTSNTDITTLTVTSTPTSTTSTTTSTITNIRTSNTDTTAPTVTSTPTSNTDTTAPTVTSTPTSNTDTTAPTVTSTLSSNTDTTAPTVTSTTSSNTDTTAPTVTSTPSSNTDTTAPTVTSTPSSNTDTTAPTVTSTLTSNTDTTAPTVTSTPSSNTDTTAPTVTSTPTSNTDTTAPTVTSTSTATTESITPNTATSTPTSPPGSTIPATTSNTYVSTILTPGSSTPGKEDSCKDGSLYVNLHNDYFCLCPEGYYYNSSKCNKGKIFPGIIKLKTSYTPEFENKASEEYQSLYTQVTTFFENTFNNTDYGQTVIVKVSTSPSARSEMRASDQGVDVEVVNIFTETTKEDEKSISNAITSAIKSTSNFIGYDKQSLCDYYGCEKPSDQNDCDRGSLCECKKGLVRPIPQMLMCVDLGPTCPDACNAESKKQCLVTSSGSANCMCLPGYKQDSNGTCRECAFGYSGVNCTDSFQLILTIVGTIAGIFILGMVIALIVSMRLKNKGRDVEEEILIEKDLQHLRLKETGFSNLGAEGSIFPKIRVNLPRDNQPENPYTRQGILPRADY